MKLKERKISLIILTVLLILSFIPLLFDPFEVPPKKTKVNFWVWLYREVYELIRGEVV